MAVTTLTGTTWYLNEVPDTSIESTISVLFSVQGSESQYDVIYKNSSRLLHFAYEIVGGALFTVYSTKTGWADESYRTITFLSEIVESTSTLTQSEFISWLEANATRVIPEPEYVDKVSLISGDEYYIKDTISGYLTKEDILPSGTIYISETSEGKVSISDTNNGIASRFIRFHAPTPTITNLTNTMWALKSDSELAGASISTTNSFNINFTAEYGDYEYDEYVGIIFSPSSSSSNALKIGFNYDSEYTEWVYDGAWYNNDNSYRVILINSGDDVSNSELISLLSRYAYQINIDVTSSADVILEFNSTLNFYNLASGTSFNATCTTYDGSSWIYIKIVDGGLSYNDRYNSVSQVVYNSSSGWVDERWRRITISNINTWSHDHITGDLWWAILNSTVVS